MKLSDFLTPDEVRLIKKILKLFNGKVTRIYEKE